MNVKTKENGILEESLNKIAGSLNDILNDNLKITPPQLANKTFYERKCFNRHLKDSLTISKVFKLLIELNEVPRPRLPLKKYT